MRNSLFTFCALGLLVSTATAGEKVSPPLTAKAAIEIARAVAVERVSAAAIQSEEPLSAKLNERNNWMVTGWMPKGSLGGVVEVEIDRLDGRVLGVVHGQ